MMRGYLLLNALWIIGGVYAAETKQPPSREVRFLALGDLPPYRQEIRGGVRYELEPPPGSIPPREAHVGVGDEDAGVVRLTLGRVSRGIKVPGGAGTLALRRKNDGGDALPWLRLKRPEAGDFIVLLWRDRTAGSWEVARSLVLPASFPAGSVTLVNVASGPVTVAVDQKKFVLTPGRPVSRVLPAGKPVPFQLGLSNGKGGLTRVVSRSLEQASGERTIVLVYRSDGDAARSPVGVKVLRERAASP